MVVGISPDKPSTLRKFKEKFGFPFPLVADQDKSAAEKFGVLKEKSMYGRKFLGVERTTFVISREGKITAMISGLKPDEHPQAALDSLAKGK